MKAIHIIAFILLVIGGLNWGLVGAFHYNLVGKIFGDGSTITTVIYVLVGLSAIWEVIGHKGNCRRCSSGAAPAAM